MCTTTRSLLMASHRYMYRHFPQLHGRQGTPREQAVWNVIFQSWDIHLLLRFLRNSLW